MHLSSLILFFLLASISSIAEPFRFRGYYTTFMRMPNMGLPEWKEMIDCMQQDGANTLLLWTSGGFRSKEFPITWKYNADHKNIEHDFVRDLIDYSHARGIRILLGFTPFGYDGVNQFPLEHPELKAKKPDGQPVDPFGFHCWGWSLCPSQAASQEFMLDYIREMVFEFYPNADGLLIESSDYNICRCPDCGAKYYHKEFQFVRQISNELWAKNPRATIIVYPHYFTGQKVNAGTVIETESAREPFDARWTLFFTPHSAHFDSNLLAKTTSSIFSNDGPSLGTPWSIRDGARLALANHITGYVPSFEPFSYILPPQEARGHPTRIKPLGFDWLPDGKMPLRELPARLQRMAYREYSKNPNLSDADFHHKLAQELCNGKPSAEADLFFLQGWLNRDRNWNSSSPLVEPQLLNARNDNWKKDRRAAYHEALERLRQMDQRYSTAPPGPESELHDIAQFILQRWKPYEAQLIPKD
jgi:hypothetical protein